MPLTAIDVQQKTFMKVMRGYDLDEVDDFLDEVVISLSDHEKKLHDAQQRISILETQALGRGDTESAISRALIAAQRSADQIIAEAKAEAGQIIAGAKSDAESLAADRDRERSAIEAEIREMRRLISELRSRLGELAVLPRQVLDEMESEIDSTVTALETPTRPAPSAYVDLADDAELPAVGDPDDRVEEVMADETPSADDEESDEAGGVGGESLGWEVITEDETSAVRTPRPWEEV